MFKSKKNKWTVIGGGNGGQTTAGHLGMMGFNVTLYDIFEETVFQINEQGGIYLEGALEGFGNVKATMNIKKALKDANIVIVTVPATSHEFVAKTCAPYLKDEQIIIINPAATFGSLQFRKNLDDEGCKAKIILAETNTLLYGCRIIHPGRTRVFGLKNRILIASIPAAECNKAVNQLQQAFPQFEKAKNILVTSLDNTNPILHPATTILNTGIIESEQDWRFYVDGFTPSVGQYVEKMDKERIDIGQELDIHLESCLKQVEIEYDVLEDTLSGAMRNNPVYRNIKGDNTLDTRYLTEDIPMGLVPIVSLGKMLALPVQRMEAVINMGELLLNQNLRTNARTLKSLGVNHLNKTEFLHFIESGEMPKI